MDERSDQVNDGLAILVEVAATVIATPDVSVLIVLFGFARPKLKLWPFPVANIVTVPRTW